MSDHDDFYDLYDDLQTLEGDPSGGGGCGCGCFGCFGQLVILLIIITILIKLF